MKFNPQIISRGGKNFSIAGDPKLIEEADLPELTLMYLINSISGTSRIS